MRQFYLAEITTKDKLALQGLYAEPNPTSPRLRGARRAILWMHGLSSVFYNEPVFSETIADAANAQGWGFVQFNSRGHDLLAGLHKVDGTPPYGYSYYQAGAGREIFTESVLDIEAGIDFLMAQGFSEIIVGGHSTGANKACYFAATQNNPHVIGSILSGPMSDRLHAITDQVKFKKDLAHMHELVDAGRGDELLVGYFFFPMTPKRFISLFEPKSTEDVFDYGDPEPKLATFSKIQLPLLVLLYGNDEGADRPMAEIKQAFDSHAKSLKYSSVIIPNALHRFNGHEQEVADTIIGWAKTI